MKFSFVLFLLLDIPYLKGQQKIEEFEHVLLKLKFPSYYNIYSKSCCKLYPGGCYKLLDSAGFTCELLRGRVTTTEKDGWIEFKISNVRFVDGGYYRCVVLGTQNRIYSDYYVEVSEVSVPHSQTQPLLTTTVKTPNNSTTLPGSSRPAPARDHSDRDRVPWSLGLPLAVIVSIAVMILITSVIGIVCCRVEGRRKPPGKQFSGHERHRLHNSGLHSSPEANTGVCKPEDAASGIPRLDLERRARWDGGVLHTGNPPVNPPGRI
ncbi:uncharacterized protein LOC130199814 isoform X2 [Pseudoliparis swirei]|uniref:uncharacterized protein LOC130199814 isoform X2 n=1 Tax=Pseudoliparis swirei TaxID=2059687 RepID=UPI0024BF08C7|nr:uncharacterized protein LOC130199814 isoform X2 [Pseudoliparis swirei]